MQGPPKPTQTAALAARARGASTTCRSGHRRVLSGGSPQQRHGGEAERLEHGLPSISGPGLSISRQLGEGELSLIGDIYQVFSTQSSHTYRRASDSSSSSIVPGLVTGEVPAADGGEVITIIVILDMIKIILLVLITTYCISGGGGGQQDGFKSVARRDLSEVASSEDQSSTRSQDQRLEAGNIVFSQDLGKY